MWRDNLFLYRDIPSSSFLCVFLTIAPNYLREAPCYGFFLHPQSGLPDAPSSSRVGLHQAAGLPMIVGVELPEHSYHLLRCRKVHRSSDRTVPLPPPAAIADESQEQP